MRILNGKKLQAAMLACELMDSEMDARRRMKLKPKDQCKGAEETQMPTNEKFVLATSGLTIDEFVARLKARGYEVGKNNVLKWLKGKNRPTDERLDLMQAILGYEITDEPPARRVFGTPREISSLAA